MRISLINPPFTLKDLTGKTKSMKGVMNIIQPLGLAYIAAYLEENGYEVKIHDCQCLDMNSERLVSKLKIESPEIIGFTSTTPIMKNIVETTKRIRQELPNTIIVIGGPHVSALPEHTISLDCFDIGVIGEGEVTTLELVKSIEKNGLNNLKGVKGIVFKKNKKIIKTLKRPHITDLDKLPFPARHLLPPLKRYRPTPASYKKLPQSQIMTSRGCPYFCTFCDRAVFGSTIRFRSAKNVFDEIEELINVYGMKDLKFFDDTFTISEKRIYQICEEFEKRKIDLPWSCLTKVDKISKKMLIKMKKTGCWQILFGLESMDERVLASLNKVTTVEQNRRAVKLAKKVGISVRINFIYGTPSETIKSMETTLHEAIKLNVDLAHFYKFIPYPGNEIYSRLVKEGYKFDPLSYPNQLDHETINYSPPKVSSKQLLKWLDKSYKRYYFRPKFFFLHLSRIRTLYDIERLFKGFLVTFRLLS